MSSETHKPLQGKRILITRPRDQSAAFATALIELGASVEELPLIRISAPDSWSEFDFAFANLSEYAWLVFASVNAVESTLKRIAELNQTLNWKEIKIAAVGPSTAATLQAAGIEPTLLPAKAVADTLAEEFPKASNTRGSTKVLWVKTNIGRSVIKDVLEQKGWAVKAVESYNTEGPQNPSDCANKIYKMLSQQSLDLVTFTSSETVKQFHNVLLLACNNQESTMLELLSNCKLCVIGPETGKTCLQKFGRVDVQPEHYNISALAQEIAKQS